MTATATVSKAWANRGYADGFAERAKSTKVPDDCRGVYLARYRVGQLERRRAARTEDA